MAHAYFGGSLHEIKKTYSSKGGNCTKCGKGSVLFWQIKKVKREFPHPEMARYCYSCTQNKWNVAGRLYRESLS